MRRRTKVLIAVPVALVALVLGGTWLYFNVISDDAPAPVTFSTRDQQTGSTVAGAAVTPGSLTGVWRPTPASYVLLVFEKA